MWWIVVVHKLKTLLELSLLSFLTVLSPQKVNGSQCFKISLLMFDDAIVPVVANARKRSVSVWCFFFFF